eukprot:364177-Chlamydomonas_euryale.AAC.2
MPVPYQARSRQSIHMCSWTLSRPPATMCDAYSHSGAALHGLSWCSCVWKRCLADTDTTQGRVTHLQKWARLSSGAKAGHWGKGGVTALQKRARSSIEAVERRGQCLRCRWDGGVAGWRSVCIGILQLHQPAQAAGSARGLITHGITRVCPGCGHGHT